jgi:hypothetical protein
LLLGAAPLAFAAPDFNDEGFVRAATVVMTYDYLAGGCAERGGLSSDARKLVAEWEARNQVALVRQRLVELENDRVASGKIAQLRSGIRTAMQSVYPQQSCPGAAALVKLPASQIATENAAVLAALAPAANTSGAKPAEAAPSPRATKSANSAASQLAPLIDSFAFDTRTTMGVGGFLTTTVYPVVLFRDGRALKDIKALASPGGIVAHQRTNAKSWTRWRRSNSRIQLQDSEDGWRSLAFSATYGALPNDFRLDGSFSSLSGVGTLGVGGTDSVVAWRSYAFSKNGLVVRGGGAGAYAAVSGGSTAVSSIAPSQRGRYRIDGLTLFITYDDGSSESRLIVTDPKDPTGAIWLDGTGYAQRRN